MSKTFSHFVTLLLIAVATISVPSGRQLDSDEELVTRIRELGATESQAADVIFHLTDAIGPRSVGAPGLRAAEQWVVKRLQRLGLQRVRIESNSPMDVGDGLLLEPPGWSSNRITVQQLAPWQDTLVGVPVLYSPSTPGIVTGDVMIAPIPRPSERDVTAFISQYRGRLRGKFLLTSNKELPIAPVVTFHQYTREELHDLAAATTPAPRSPAVPMNQSRGAGSTVRQVLDQWSRLFSFLNSEGVRALIGAAPGDGGTLALRPPPAPPKLTSAPPPMFDLAAEYFNRLIRLAKNNVPVRLEVRLDTEWHEPSGTENVLGEIPGGDRADEIVLIGAHLDSWHVGTGATDNAAGVAAVLEATRLLTTLKIPLRRTVQVAFWGGEEFGRLGSQGYVSRYLIDPSSGTHLPGWEKLSAYLNLDFGSGRIRGIYLQGNDRLKPLFESWMSGLGDGGLVATVRSTLGSDQASFERIGIPGLSFIQDPLNYEQRTHHTNMDHADYVRLEDVSDSAITLAALTMRIANAPTILPRKPAQ